MCYWAALDRRDAPLGLAELQRIDIVNLQPAAILVVFAYNLSLSGMPDPICGALLEIHVTCIYVRGGARDSESLPW